MEWLVPTVIAVAVILVGVFGAIAELQDDARQAKAWKQGYFDATRRLSDEEDKRMELEGQVEELRQARQKLRDAVAAALQADSEPEPEVK